jgi:hypothetical protein
MGTRYMRVPVLFTTNTFIELFAAPYALLVGVILALKVTCFWIAGFHVQVLVEPLTVKFEHPEIFLPSA